MPFRTNILSFCKEKTIEFKRLLEENCTDMQSDEIRLLRDFADQLCSKIESGARKSSPKEFIQHLNATSDIIMEMEEYFQRGNSTLVNKMGLVLRQMNDRINGLRIEL